MNKPLLWLAGFLFLTAGGCVNPYRTNFNSTRERFPNWLEGRLAKPAENPRLLVSNDIQSDNWRLFEQGYVMVGFSKFDGQEVNVDLALQQGRNVGADVVVVQKKYTKTLTETVTVTQWLPSETTEVRESGTVSGSRGSQTVDRRTEITTSRGPETVYVPKEVDYFEQSATFWRKLERPVFGAFVQDLSEDQRRQLQSNRGLVVRAIVVDSPAFNADLLKDDILIKIDGEPVPSAQLFYETLASRTKPNVTLTILRGGRTLEKTVTLRL